MVLAGMGRGNSCSIARYHPITIPLVCRTSKYHLLACLPVPLHRLFHPSICRCLLSHPQSTTRTSWHPLNSMNSHTDTTPRKQAKIASCPIFLFAGMRNAPTPKYAPKYVSTFCPEQNRKAKPNRGGYCNSHEDLVLLLLLCLCPPSHTAHTDIQ